MSDPYARALSAIDYLFGPDLGLGPVERGALDEVRDAILEAHELHAAALEELRMLRAMGVSERVTMATLGSSVLPASADGNTLEKGNELLAILDLFPDEPLPISPR